MPRAWTPRNDVGDHPELADKYYITRFEFVGYYVWLSEGKMAGDPEEEDGTKQDKTMEMDTEV